MRAFGYIVPEFQLGRRYQNLFMVGIMLSHLTPAINSSLNFFFYFKMGSKFRATVYAIFGMNTSKQNNRNVTNAKTEEMTISTVG